jgi:hypothetical protein
MTYLISQLRVSAWAGTLCKALSSLKKIKAGFWSHVLVAVPLLIAILTLWPTFAGTADTKKATELAKWTAKKDFIEFCQSVGADEAEAAFSVLTINFKSSTGSLLDVICSLILWDRLRFSVDKCHTLLILLQMQKQHSARSHSL